jgi:tetratricopeptide (TPR) repeat protein
MGREAGQQFIDAAKPTHPSLIDENFVVAGLYNTKNVPAAFWIDEAGAIVRANDPIYIQRRNRETGETTINERYLNALRDWVAKGPASVYVTPPDETTRRLGEPDADNELAMAHFRLGSYLSQAGHKDAAVQHFKRAHALKPDNWNYKRQAWNLGNIEQDYGTTFQQEMQKGIPFYPPLQMPD